MLNSKRGIGPVVATALLLVVAIVAVVSFQTWFNTFSSSVIAEVENKDSQSAPQILNVIGDTLYVKGTQEDQLLSLKVNGVDCTKEVNFSEGVQEITLDSCLNSSSSSGIIDVTLTTNKGVSTKKFYVNSLSLSSSCTNNTNEGFNAGNGSSSNPFLVCNCEQLQNIDNYRSSSFKLSQDIDCSATSSWNGGKGFMPIGNGSTFSGELNGAGYAVDSLYINRSASSESSYTGLFSYLFTGSNVYNLSLSNVDITGAPGDDTGALSGLLRTSVEQIKVTGTVRGTNDIGGIVGSTIAGAQITDAYFVGTVEGENRTGGIVGDSVVPVTRVYFNGNVSGFGNVGGLVGETHDEIIDSVMVGNVNGSDGYYVGSLTGTLQSTGQISNTFWNNVTGNPDVNVDNLEGPDSSVAIQNNISYFYDNTNPPYNNTWNSSTWLFSGSALPTFVWE